MTCTDKSMPSTDMSEVMHSSACLTPCLLDKMKYREALSPVQAGKHDVCEGSTTAASRPSCNLLGVAPSSTASHGQKECSNEVCIALQTLPEAPVELVAELARRYVLLYEMITGEEFRIPNLEEDPVASMKASVQAALQS